MFHKISYPFLENLSNIQILCYSKQFYVEIFRIVIQINNHEHPNWILNIHRIGYFLNIRESTFYSLFKSY